MTTEGTWTGNYGGDGEIIANDVSNVPAYATVGVNGSFTYTWASSTGDPRAPQVSQGSGARIASTFYSGGSFSFDVNLTDGNAHRVALYLLDWDSTARAETITISDAASGTVLDAKTFSSFHNGVYAAWNIAGHVIIQVNLTAGANAVVSGLFFGPPSSAGSGGSASYAGTDTATEGTWSGHYGADGQIIANAVNGAPAYASVALAGGSPYTWSAATGDVRALQTGSGSTTRIASTYYSGGSFIFDLNLTDGNTHRISLYLLDWDSTTRAESIAILDGAE